MIDATKFAAWMAALTDRFNRPLLPGTQQAYYATLSAELTTEEFERAASLAFRDETFWPSPRVIVEKVHPPVNVKASASEAFEGIRQAIMDFGGPHVASQLAPNLPPPAKRALRAIGGAYAVGMASYTELPHLARRFTEVYEAAVADAPQEALPALAYPHRIEQSAGPKLLREGKAS
jgi:hypothetical protein